MKMKKIYLLLSTLTISAIPVITIACGQPAATPKPNDPTNPMNPGVDNGNKPAENPDLRAQSKLLINKNQKIKYVAFGDSISAGFDGTLNKDYPGKKLEDGSIDGVSYSAFLARALNINNRVEKFENYSLTGSTLETWDKILFSSPSKEVDETLKSLFGENHKEITDKMKENIKESNLITFNLGANDFISTLMKTILDKDFFGSAFSGNSANFNPAEIFPKLLKSISELLQKIQTDFTNFITKLKAFAPNANINLVGYPLPFLWFENVINDFVKKLIGIQNFDYYKFFNQQIDKIFKDLTTKTGINYINAYNHDYWKENKKTLTSLSFDIHPGINGYKKMALDIYLKITNRLSKKEDFDKLGKFDFTDEYIKDDLKHTNYQIEVENYNENLKKSFGDSTNEYVSKITDFETTLQKSKSTKNFGKRIKNTIHNFSDIFRNILIRLTQTDFFKKIDSENRIAARLLGTSNFNRKLVIVNFLESLIKSEFIDVFFSVLDSKLKEAFEKNKDGNFMITDFIQLFKETLLDKRTKDEFMYIAAFEPFKHDSIAFFNILQEELGKDLNDEKRQLIDFLGWKYS